MAGRCDMYSDIYFRSGIFIALGIVSTSANGYVVGWRTVKPLV